MVIYKYSLYNPHNSKIKLAIGSKFLSVRIQGPPYSIPETIVLWFEVDPTTELAEERVFQAVNTGMRCPEGLYLGTCESSTGIIWHVYERRGKQ